MVKSRQPVQVSPNFKKRLDEMKKKYMMTNGRDISLRDITEEIIKSPSFTDIEKDIIKSSDVKLDIRLRLDGRKR